MLNCLCFAWQVDEKPSEDYSDVGGLDKQIKELVEAIVLPVTHKDKFKALGIRPPKGTKMMLLLTAATTGRLPPQRGCCLLLCQKPAKLCIWRCWQQAP